MSVNEDWESSSFVAGPIFSLFIANERIDLMYSWEFFISFS